MSLTPALLQNMDFEHAINALRAELPNDLAWLIDWIESTRPETDEQAIVDAAENHGLSAADIDVLGCALADVPNAAKGAAELLTVLDDFPLITGAPADLRDALEIAAACSDAGVTTVAEVEVALGVASACAAAGLVLKAE